MRNIPAASPKPFPSYASPRPSSSCFSGNTKSWFRVYPWWLSGIPAKFRPKQRGELLPTDPQRPDFAPRSFLRLPGGSPGDVYRHMPAAGNLGARGFGARYVAHGQPDPGDLVGPWSRNADLEILRRRARSPAAALLVRNILRGRRRTNVGDWTAAATRSFEWGADRKYSLAGSRTIN